MSDDIMMTVREMQELYDFPSLYSLDPKTATTQDIQRCLDHGADINEPDDRSEDDYCNVVNYFAVHSDNPELVAFLFEHGARPDPKLRQCGDFVLAEIENINVFDVMLEHGVDIDYCYHGKKIWNVMLDRDNPDDFIRHIFEKRGWGGDAVPLSCLIYSDDPDMIRTKLSFSNKILNEKIGGLFVAERAMKVCKNPESLKELIQAGGKYRKGKMLKFLSRNNDLDKALILRDTGRFNDNEIFTALCTKDSPAFRFFSSLNVDINYQVEALLGTTPLIETMSTNDKDVLEWLTDRGAKVNPELFFDLLKRENLFAVKVLLEHGFDPDVRSEGKTALMAASSSGISSYCITSELIKAGADVNARDDKGRTALMYASDTWASDLLLNEGADPDAEDNEGKTALEIFMENDWPNQRDCISRLFGCVEIRTQVLKDKLLDYLLFGKRKRQKPALFYHLHCKLRNKDAFQDDFPLSKKECSLVGLVKDLVEIGADINAVIDDEKRNPDRLSICERAVSDRETSFNIKKVKALLQNGMDPAKNPRLLKLARQHNNHIIAEMLIRAGADGNTP